MTDVITTDAEHSDIMGGSKAAMRINCPGSYLLEQESPPQPESEFAAEGTCLHEAMEYILLDRPEDAPKDNLNDVLGMVFHDIVITQELIDDKLQPALDAFHEIIETYGGGLDYLVEVKVNYGDTMPGAFGTIDILGVFKSGKVLYLDWKFGDGVPVDVKGNMQLAFYAGGSFYDDDEDLQTMLGTGALDVIFAIVQPRRGYEAPHYQTWETDSDWIEDFVDTAIAAYEVSQKPNATVKTGSHCRWCRAAAFNCPEKKKQIGAAQSMPSEFNDPITMSKALDVADELEKWIKQVRAVCHAELEAGVKIPGRKLVPKRGKRIWNDEEAARKTLVRQIKTEAAHEPRKLISPAQAEKKLGKQKYSKLISKYVTMHSSGNTMALDSDSRPDVSDELTQLGAKGSKTGKLFSS